MPFSREQRVMMNSKEQSVSSGDVKGTLSHSPSSRNMDDGEQVYARESNKPLALYKKFKGVLWKTYLSYNGNQYVDRDINIAGNINLSNKLITKNYPAFAVRQSASADNQEIESGAFETVVFDEELYDNGGNFSTSNYSFTAPVNGIYHFNARILWDADATDADGEWAAEDYHQISLSKNDRASTPTDQNDFIAQFRHTIQGDIEDKYLSNNVISDAKLDIGDYVSVAVKHVTAAGHSQYTYAPTNTNIWTSFTGHLICAL